MPKELQKVSIKDDGAGMFDFKVKAHKDALPFEIKDVVGYSVSREVEGRQIVSVSFFANVDMQSE